MTGLENKFGENGFDPAISLGLLKDLLHIFGNSIVSTNKYLKVINVNEWKDWAVESSKNEELEAYKYVVPEVDIIYKINDAYHLVNEPLNDDVLILQEYCLKAGITGWSTFVQLLGDYVSFRYPKNHNDQISEQLFESIIHITWNDASCSNNIYDFLDNKKIIDYIRNNNNLYAHVMVLLEHKSLRKRNLKEFYEEKKILWETLDSGLAKKILEIAKNYNLYYIIWSKASNPKNKLLIDILDIASKGLTFRYLFESCDFKNFKDIIELRRVNINMFDELLLKQILMGCRSFPSLIKEIEQLDDQTKHQYKNEIKLLYEAENDINRWLTN